MTVAHFELPGLNLFSSVVDSGQTLIKRVCLAIEGDHNCNQGKRYAMNAKFIRELGINLNNEIGEGREISLFSDIESGKPHDKSTEAKFGKLDGFVECRPVTEADLPNPNARKMLGKMALFGVARIFKHLDKVRSGAISAMSPGIDMGRKLIVELSAVPIASMPGVRLFSYKDVKADRSRVLELRDKAIECVDTFIEAVRMFERNDAEMTSSITALQESFGQFTDDLAELFEVPVAEAGVEYATSPWARETVKTGFSHPWDETLSTEEKNNVLNEVKENAKQLRQYKARRFSNKVDDT